MIHKQKDNVWFILLKKQQIIKFKRHIIIEHDVSLKNVSFEGNNVTGNETTINQCNIELGTYMGSNCDLKKFRIGRFSSIASGVNIIRGQHPVSMFITTSSVFYSHECGGEYSYMRRNYYSPYRYANKKVKDVVTT